MNHENLKYFFGCILAGLANRNGTVNRPQVQAAFTSAKTATDYFESETAERPVPEPKVPGDTPS